MGKPFEKSRTLVNESLKPSIEFLKVMKDADSKLIVAGIEDFMAQLEDITDAMNNPEQKVALFEFGLTPQLFYAFDCAPLCMETFPGFFTAGMKDVFHEFVEAAEEAGLPSDVCSTDRFIVGAALKGELPSNSFFVASSSPCDGTRIAYPIMKKNLDIPTLFIEAPYTYEREGAGWYGGQIKVELIPFLEQVTGKKFDPDRFREVIEESNRAYELMLDINDAYTIKPCPHPAALRGMAYGSFISSAGHPRHTEFVRTIHEDVMRRIKEGVSPQTEEKHRVLWVHVPPNFDNEFFTWMEEALGASVMTSSLASTPILPLIDTTNLDTMLEGYAWQGLDMTMSIMRFDSNKLLEFSMKAYRQYKCDSVIVSQHVGCNSICGASGILRQYFRENDIPALFLDLDYNDDRVISSEPLREQVEEFFTTVMV